MLHINKLSTIRPATLVFGNHQPIIQSMLDFDYLCGRKVPTVKVIITGSQGYQRMFYGTKEIMLPTFIHPSTLTDTLKDELNLFINAASGRRAYSSTIDIFRYTKNIFGGVIFAENVPEMHAVQLIRDIKQDMQKVLPKKHKEDSFIIGPASVGLLIPGHLKLGAIAGTDYRQLIQSRALTQGNVAVLSASGGMTNELINTVAQTGNSISFAMSFGGDRFPVTSPADAFLQAEADKHTEHIVYYGELGGDDEYRLIELVRQKKITKKIYAYIAGSISELFDEPPQFGHAKAMAKTADESAQAKRHAMQKHGIMTPRKYNDFINCIKRIPQTTMKTDQKDTKKTSLQDDSELDSRKHAMFASSLSKETHEGVEILGENLIDMAQKKSFAQISVSMFLGKQVSSKELIQLIDLILKLGVDHGPSVSGAVNTMIAARAARDLPSSLSAGILTIGDRFGGAVNGAAACWLNGVHNNIDPQEFVESYAREKKYIPGIGHKKYRKDNPDPRVKILLETVQNKKSKNNSGKYLAFAQNIENITTDKKANLILNFDGTIAAVMLDMLAEKEGYSKTELEDLVRTEFFNAFFVLARTVGFIGHYLDQRRLDERLFRLPTDEIASVK